MKNFESAPYRTVLTISIGFMVVYYFTSWTWAIQLSFTIGIISLVSSKIAKLIEVIWFRLAWVLSLIVPNILLTLIFFLILYPLATLSKIFGDKDPLMLKKGNGSLFQTSNKEFPKSSFEKTW